MKTAYIKGESRIFVEGLADAVTHYTVERPILTNLSLRGRATVGESGETNSSEASRKLFDPTPTFWSVGGENIA